MAHTPGSHLTGTARDTARQEAARLYTAGSTIHAVADHLGRSYGLTYRLLHEADVPMRKQGGWPRKADA